MTNPFPFTVGQVLTAAQMNGIGEATAYTPTVTAISGTLTTITATGRFVIVNKFMYLRFNVVLTTVGTGATGLTISLPSGVSINGLTGGVIGNVRETSVTGDTAINLQSGTTNIINVIALASGRNYNGFIIVEID